MYPVCVICHLIWNAFNVVGIYITEFIKRIHKVDLNSYFVYINVPFLLGI